jgi:hypothetical protein
VRLPSLGKSSSLRMVDDIGAGRCSPTSLDPDEFPHTAISTSCGAAVDNSDGLLDRGRARTKNAEVLRARLFTEAHRSRDCRVRAALVKVPELCRFDDHGKRGLVSL